MHRIFGDRKEYFGKGSSLIQARLRSEELLNDLKTVSTKSWEITLQSGNYLKDYHIL